MVAGFFEDINTLSERRLGKSLIIRILPVSCWHW